MPIQWTPRDTLAAAAVSRIIAENQGGHLCRYSLAGHFLSWKGHCLCACMQYSFHECEVCSICDKYKCEVK